MLICRQEALFAESDSDFAVETVMQNTQKSYKNAIKCGKLNSDWSTAYNVHADYSPPTVVR